MGSTLSCFDRWGKRSPNGALFIPKKKTSLAFSANSISYLQNNSGSPKPKGTVIERSSRRRQTYSSNASKNPETDVSSYDEEHELDDSDSHQELTTSDVREKKLGKYRRELTRIAKLKTHLFSATVKVTCSKDGREIEWYKGKSEEYIHKPAGYIPVDKITSVKSQADNPKGLTITVNNPAPTSYYFTFKTKEERVSWQEQLESFQKFMSMR